MEFDFNSLGTWGILIALIIDRMWKGYTEYRTKQQARQLPKVNNNPILAGYQYSPGQSSTNIIMSRLTELTQLINKYTDPKICKERGEILKEIQKDLNSIAIDVGVLKSKVEGLERKAGG